jgi:hypothetical protein
MVRFLLFSMSGLATGLMIGTPIAEAGKKVHHTIHGVVVSVDHNNGVMAIKVHHHAKKGAPGAGTVTEKTIHVNQNTTYQIVTGKKGVQLHQPATLANVQPGEHVVIVPAAGGHGNLAARVTIMGRQKG